MNTINLKIIIRNIQKQKLSNLLSILVLTSGMASFMLFFFYIRYEKGFDHSWTNSDQIYRIALNKTLPDGSTLKTAGSYMALGWVAIAVPVTWYIMNRWLQNYTNRINLDLWIFLFVVIISISIAVATVSWQSWRAARRNPVEALRYE